MTDIKYAMMKGKAIAEETYIKFLNKEIVNYPEDEWIPLSSDWDLNMWTEDSRKDMPVCHASIYPVTNKDGIDYTDYDIHYNVWDN